MRVGVAVLVTVGVILEVTDIVGVIVGVIVSVGVAEGVVISFISKNLDRSFPKPNLDNTSNIVSLLDV